MSAQLPLCIPVCWREGNSSFLAYHHGWTDARVYDVVEIFHAGRPQSAFAGYSATVDDFGNLVRTAGPRRDHEAHCHRVEEYLAKRTTLGPWFVVQPGSRETTFRVRRDAGNNWEWLRNAAGRHLRFRSIEAAHAAIAKATRSAA
jgi:hypothetical protein